jgi:hypothetical protein
MYKIVTSGTTKVFSLGEISRNIKVSSEVYAISDAEIYLGLISHKTLVLFATEFAEYAIKNYTSDRVPEADLCISLIRKWISGDTSVSNEKLNSAANAAYSIASYSDKAATSHSGEAATRYSAEAVSYAICAVNIAANAASANSGYAAADANGNAVYAAYYASDTAGKDKDKEFIRQGTFIIDFLKSGKHLFLV